MFLSPRRPLMKKLSGLAKNMLSRLRERRRPSDSFSFCVGRPWPKSFLNPNGTSICVYAYGDTVKYGTMTYAENFRDYVNEQTKERNFIYKLVQVSK